MENIKELAINYSRLCKEKKECLNKIAKKIVETCNPVIEDLNYSIGWEEGMDTICFYSDSHNIIALENRIGFEDIIRKTIPELECQIETPIGIWLTEKEVKKIKKLLIENLEVNNPNSEKEAPRMASEIED